MERLRVGHATAALLTMFAAPWGGTTVYQAADVFGDLGEGAAPQPVQSEDDMRAAISLFPGARRVHHA